MSRRPTAPLADVAIVGVYNTEQARHLPGKDSMSVAFEAAYGALSDAGLTPLDVDGVAGPLSSDFIYQTGIAPAWYTHNAVGIPTLLESVFAIQSGMATVVLVLSGTAGRYTSARGDGSMDTAQQRDGGAVRDIHRDAVRTGGAALPLRVRGAGGGPGHGGGDD